MRGFTLLEAVIVALVLGIAAATAAPSLAQTWARVKVDAGVSAVVAALQYAQGRAVGSGATWRVVFNAAQDTFQVESALDPNLATILNTANATINASVLDAGTTPAYSVVESPDVAGRTYVVNLRNGGNTTDIDLVSAVAGSGSTVTFNARGTPVETGTITLRRAGYTRVISISAINGLVTVS